MGGWGGGVCVGGESYLTCQPEVCPVLCGLEGEILQQVAGARVVRILIDAARVDVQSESCCRTLHHVNNYNSLALVIQFEDMLPRLDRRNPLLP